MNALKRLIPAVVANILPLIGVIFLDWDIYFIMYLYTLELWVILVYFFIAYMVDFKKKCKKTGEFLLILVVMVFMLLFVSILWIALPLDMIARNADKASQVHSPESTGLIQIFAGAFNPSTTTQLLIFAISYLIVFIYDEGHLRTKKMGARFGIGFATVMLIIMAGAYLNGQLGLPVPIISIFIIIKLLASMIPVDEYIDKYYSYRKPINQ